LTLHVWSKSSTGPLCAYLVSLDLQSNIICSRNVLVQYWCLFLFSAQDGAYDTKQDFLHHKTVHTAPNGISYRARRCIRHQTGYLTAQDGAYATKRDFLPHKTVHTSPNRSLPRSNGNNTNIECERKWKCTLSVQIDVSMTYYL
jgi:hypothetical protein